MYIRPGAGVGALKMVFGGRKRNGHRHATHGDSSGSIARKALQALEKLKLVEKTPEGGRRISKDGQRDLDQIAMQCAKTA